MDFIASKDDRQLRRSTHPLDAHELEFALKHVLVEEKQSAKSLVLGRGSDIAVDGEVAEEGGNFFFTHLVGMTSVVEEDETADPINVGLLGSYAVAFNAQMPAL